MFCGRVTGAHSSVGTASQHGSRQQPYPRRAGSTKVPTLRASPPMPGALHAGATKAALLPLLALGLLWFSAEAWAERDVRIERDADTIRIDARLRVDAHHHIAWQVLTDYDNLARFVPGLTSSAIVNAPGALMRLKQTGQSGFLWLTLPIEVVVQIEEIPLEAIRFTAVGGTLKSKSGEWRIEAQGDATLLIYRASIVPGFWVPPLIGTAMMGQDVRGKLVGVANEIMRRAATAQSATPGPGAYR